MVLWWLLAIAFLLFALQYREHYVDPERNIPRPVLTSDGSIPGIWQSRIDANSPISSNDMDYFLALQAFYDKVYAPSPTRPKDTDVEAFLKTTDATVAGIDPIALRKMIGASFSIEATLSAAAREEKQIVTPGALAGFSGSNLQPGNARDQVRDRTEEVYIPVDSRKGELPEGLYKPTEQTTPLGRGETKIKSISWNSMLPYWFCREGDSACAENVL